MKLLMDIYACQTNSRFRGIGRYVNSLARKMAELRDSHEMVILADAVFPESFESLRQEFIRLLPWGSFLPYWHPPVELETIGSLQAQITETLIQQAYQVINPHVILNPSLFEGWRQYGKVPLPDRNFPDISRVAILYDLIPLIYRERYLDPIPEYKEWYLDRLKTFNQFDLLLAISESTRQDAIRMLGISPDKIVNIAGAADSSFRQLNLTRDEKQNHLRRLGISRPFVLYIGGDDYRKNKHGALRAYAKLPQAVRHTHQLVLNGSENNENLLQREAYSLGLSGEEFVVTKWLTDKDLIILYNLCKTFFFPSLYEGFGLPVLEAMMCGAPAIASNNSSLPEVISHPNALFDASKDEEITASLNRVLTDDTFRQDLITYGLERAQQFSWETTAQRAWKAIEAVHEEKNHARERFVPLVSLKQALRIAYVSPLPPQKSAAATYSAALLPHLKKYFEIDLFIEPGLMVSDPFLRDNFAIYPWTSLIERFDDYATVIYHYENSQCQSHMDGLLQQFPGVVILHDFFCCVENTKEIYQDKLYFSHGLTSLVDFWRDAHSASKEWPANWTALRYAHAVIVPSEDYKTLVDHYYRYGWKPSITVIRPLEEGQTSESAAEACAQVINQATVLNERKVFAPLTNALKGKKQNYNTVQTLARFAAANFNLRTQTHLLIDVTSISENDSRSGIQRVVKSLIRAFVENQDHSLNMELVRVYKNHLVSAFRFTESLFDLPSGCLGEDKPITIYPGGLLFMLDSSWKAIDEYIPIFENVHRQGGKIVTMIYDLLLLRYPKLFHLSVFAFKHWLNIIITHTDELVCISKSVADDVSMYLSQTKIRLPRKLDIAHFHLGADIQVVKKEITIRDEVKQITESVDIPYFVMVGTIEPRKGHSFVLDAFELLWKKGNNYRLCFAGNIGWNVTATEKRIRNHPESGKRLFFFENSSDAEIEFLYSNAIALIIASQAEGFGLPITEAANHQIPVIASDIPVFHEVGGEGTIYFSLTLSDHLLEAVEKIVKLTDNERLELAQKIPILSWRDSAKYLLDILQGKHVYKTIQE